MKKQWAGKIWLVLIAVYLLFPLILTIMYSFVGEWTSIFPTGWTLSYYIQAFRDESFLLGLLRGVLISILPIIITGTIVIFALYTAIIYNPKLEKFIQTVCMIPYTIQGVILATSVLTLYAGSRTFLSNRILLLTCVYCIGILPFTYQGIVNSMRTINIRQLIEAAEILGATKLYAFIKVVIPGMLPGMMVSALISMSIIFGDYAIIKIIAASHYPTAQFYLYNSRTLPIQVSNAIVMVLFSITLVISFIVLMIQNREKKNTGISKSSR